MAHVYTASGLNGTDHGSGSGLDTLTACTSLVWHYTTSRSSEMGLWGKWDNPGNVGWRVLRTTGAGNDEYSFTIRTDATYVAVQTSGVSFPLDTWNCVASVSNIGYTGEVYVGDISTPLYQPSYAVQNVGSGNPRTETGSPLIVGCDARTSGYQWRGPVAMFAFWSQALSLAELRMQQFSTVPLLKTNLQIFTHYGFNGATAMQPDWSGNGHHGTPTGATVASHVPLRLFRTRPNMPFAAAMAGNPHYYYAQQQ